MKIPVKYITTGVDYDWESPYGLVMSWRGENGQLNSVNITRAEFMKLDQLERTVKWYLEEWL